jgi:hypothetical protein
MCVFILTKEHTMRYRIFLLLAAAMLVFAATGCNLTFDASGAEPLPPTDVPGTKPIVTIISPANNTQVTVGQQVLVSVNAVDSTGVTRIQLLAGGSVVKTISSQAASGERNMNALLDYTPQNVGTIELTVIAYRSSVPSDAVRLTLIVVPQTQVTPTATSPAPGPGPGPNPPPIDPTDPTCRLLTTTALNVRSGPGTQYVVLQVLATGTLVPIVGRDPFNTWWQIRAGTTIGWVSAAFVLVYGNCSFIPIIQPPPPPPTNTPTRTPTPITITPVNTPTATNTPGLPDLVITSIVGETTLPLSGATVTGNYAVTITNTGQGPTGQFLNTIAVTPDGTVTQLGAVAGLSAGESIVLTVSLTFASTGSYTITARADSDSQITEISEVNNVGILSVQVVPPV